MSVPNSSRYFISVGASAGGVEALQVFFEHVVKDGRSSYIVIQHLSPDYDSIMASLIS
ncbi:chemotaxis protein CheB, partial [Oleiphilus sp. HI0080]